MNLNSAERTYEIEPREDAMSRVGSLRRGLYERGFVPAWKRQRNTGMHTIVLARFGNTYEVRISYDMTRATISSPQVKSPEYEGDDMALIKRYLEQVLEGLKEEPKLATDMETR